MTGPGTSPQQRSRFLNVLQIAGTLSVVAVHIGAPYSQAGWIAVEMFFVMAGINMVPALSVSNNSLPAYASKRVRRLIPEVLLVWIVALLVIVADTKTPGASWFLLSAPVFAQNLSLPFFTYEFPRDWLFVPLWFVAALFQLQLLFFVVRRWLFVIPTTYLVLLFFLAGISFRLVITWFGGAQVALVSPELANALYCLPFTHLEAIGLGFLIGRGKVPTLGRFLPWFGLLALALGLANVGLSPQLVSPRSLGFELPLRTNYAHLWGYAVLALAMAALCSPDCIFHRLIQNVRLPSRLEHILNRLASLTYGVYVFHGMIISTGINGYTWLARPHAPGLRLILLAITIAEAFLLAWLFQKGWRRWRKTRRVPAPQLPGTAVEGLARNANRAGETSL